MDNGQPITLIGYRGLLFIAILCIAKNLKTHWKSIQRCFASLNMTVLEQAYSERSTFSGGRSGLADK